MSKIDFERPRLDDPLYKENPSPHGYHLSPSDNLPSPKVEDLITHTEAADLTPERFICMADNSTSPGRAPCSYYKRQLLPSQDKERVVMLRFCTAVRDEAGEFVDLGNSEILACEFREPRCVISHRRLEEFDQNLIKAQNLRRKESEPFDPLKALKESDES